MKEDWELPEDDLLQPTGKEWLFQGKMVVVPDAGFRAKTKDQDGRHKMRQGWTAPGQGSAKLNTDGSFLNNTEAGTGMVLRDHQGAVVAAACREVTRCRDATEAELMAIEEGVQLSLLWTTQPFTVETDCSEAVELLKESTPNTSIYAFRVSFIRDLLKERDITVVKISREANMVSHELAKIGRTQTCGVWSKSAASLAVDQVKPAMGSHRHAGLVDGSTPASQCTVATPFYGLLGCAVSP
ncbi:hypothetical protein QYE76_001032 [Lolium multiflorum]|uniref:RNase H type-1 domain-containing protein n=1 Tax=Lolium multiflorum TaxID=4521 RepID=A0AAD8VWX8_LOLMU|nr:hypothetical protein QYE76_001032 [Lolium multiflorum]